MTEESANKTYFDPYEELAMHYAFFRCESDFQRQMKELHDPNSGYFETAYKFFAPTGEEVTFEKLRNALTDPNKKKQRLEEKVTEYKE